MYCNKISLSTAQYAPNNSPILLKGTIENNLIIANKLGYDAIEIHMRETDYLNRNTINQILDDKNMEISAIVTGRLYTEGGCSLIHDNPYITDYAIASLKKYIDIASSYNTDIILGWIIGKIPEGVLCEERYYDRLATNLAIISEYGFNKKVRIFIEIINRYETNVFNNVSSTIFFLEKYNLENIYVHLDTFHMNIEEKDFSKAIEIAGDKLGYFHFADNQRMFVGSGMIDFGKIINMLNDIEYRGYLSVECLPIPSSQVAAKKSIFNIKNML